MTQKLPRIKKAKVRTARGRKIASTRWLQRQINDPYVLAAKQDGYRSRSAYKLIEIDDKYAILRNTTYILDLGAAPGGWSQVAVERTKKGKVIAIDLQAIAPLDNVETIIADINDDNILNKIKDITNSYLIDLVMSDIAPSSSGHSETDHLRHISLCERMLYIAQNVLKINGSCILKMLQGSESQNFINLLKNDFNKISYLKPESSRKNSREIYLIAQGFGKSTK